MHVARIYEPLVAQTSYLIGCAATGEALVIDPTRDLDRYLAEAAREGLRITHVTETHIHADFLSGARELAQRTGARLFLSDEGDADWKYQCAQEGTLVRDGDHFMVGRIRVQVVATPGHTPEHIAFLITDTAAADQPIAIATGDFLFVGDVGRPDLLERAANYLGTMEAGARVLWHSLQRLAPYPDWLQIWPGHGAGSACGKGISAIPSSTLGYERHFNWAFQITTESAFVDEVLTGQPEPPLYFATMKRLNKQGPAPRGPLAAAPRLDDDRLPALLAQGAMVVDTRPTAVSAAQSVPGTLSIPFTASFVTWAGWLIPYDTPLHFIVDDPSEDRLIELARQLALIGLDQVAGIWDGGVVQRLAARGTDMQTIPQMSVDAAAGHVSARDIAVIDVRGASEWQAGHLPGAVHIPLGYLLRRIDEVPTDRPVLVHCQGGARSAMAASLLARAGRRNVTNLVGGFAAWKGAGLPVTSAGGGQS